MSAAPLFFYFELLGLCFPIAAASPLVRGSLVHILIASKLNFR
jgi:hypothetical protein